MPKLNYSKFKIRINPESKKTQGLCTGDVIRREYLDNSRLIYSLMVVLETGTDIIHEQDSHYFIAALLEGDEPLQGELLDFIRVTNLFDKERSGALYLTASESPYLDVIDGMAVERSLCLMEEAKRITSGELFEFPINGIVTYPERLLISYRIRASKAMTDISLTLGYSDGSEVDGTDVIDASVEWEYKLTVITIDYPAQYARKLSISPILEDGEWCEVSDLNIVRLATISTFSESSKVRIGKITGIIDPVFGILEGYGAYFQNLYATRNANIAGTLTAGDENGFASTFYVGKIHKNVIPDSISCKFSGATIINTPSPLGIGNIVQTDNDTQLFCQSATWRAERIGKQYSFSIWIKAESGVVSFYQDEHYIKDIEVTDSLEWNRYKVSFTIHESFNDALYIRIQSGVSKLLLTAPQLEHGENVSLYQPTDDQLSYTEDYGAWLCKGGIGGTIQNPLLKLNEDGSICSRDGSFVINHDGTGHFAGGKFKWTKEDIELTDMTIRWGALDEETKEHILSQAQPSRAQIFVTSNLSTTQIYNRENNQYQPNWAITPLVLTPSLFINTYGQTDLITMLADPVQKTPGIKPGSAVWYKNGKLMVNGQDSCTIESSNNKYELRIKANHIGQHAPAIRYGFQAVWSDSNGDEMPITADIQFSQLANPAATIMAVAYAPEGNIFRGADKQNLKAHCDMWRGSSIDSSNAEYHWGVKDDTVFANAQLAMAAKMGSYEITLRSVNNMHPGATIYLISKFPHVIKKVDIQNKTINLTTPLTRDYAVNAVVTTPFYDSLLGAGWAVLNENNQRGVIAGWDTNEITISPEAVLNFETFKCAIKDTNLSIGNGFSGQIACDIITFTDLSDPYYLDIEGQEGFVIKNNENNIEAKAVLYRSGYEVDISGTSYTYQWKLYNNEGILVTQNYSGKRITVSKDKIETKGALICEIYERTQLIARGQVSITRLDDGEGAYSVHQTIDKTAVSCDYTGKVLSALILNSVISVHSGGATITDFTIGTIVKPLGFYSISVDQATKTITYSIMGNDIALSDTGTVTIPIIVNGENFTTSFGWFKVKEGKPGNKGEDSNLLDWVSNWNSGKTVIDSQSVITPKIFAGTKNTNGTITGMAIGKFSLSTKNASGMISSEVVNGIYGFSDGKKTFEINATGNVQLGNANEFIKYNASTGKIEFGSSVALAWVGATYIDANGIFTGTLSATTVNTISLDASQITAGIINASRIDVNSLKASLITAGNIEALTLNVTKGKIGGWALDVDSIYQGTKSNTQGAFTAADGSITIGSKGIRGFKWRFDSTGAGALAGGNISWDAAGNVTFSASVSLNWTNGINSINNALGGTSYPKLTHINAAGIYTGTLTANQVNAVGINAGSITAGTIDAARINVEALKASLITAGNINALTLTVNKGTIGGWTINSTQISKNGVYLGADGSITNSTKWKLNSDGSGQIANGNIAWDIAGNVTFSASVSLNWTNGINSINNALGGTSYPKLTHISSSGIYTGTLTANQVNAVGINAGSITTGTLSADRIASGSINASKLDAASIRAGIINTEYINGLNCTFVRGTIGGFTIGSDHISTGGIGAVGTMPIQIRTAASGSGYWYSGDYRPCGISLLWHQSSNAGHIIIGQIAASGNTVKTGFMGIQMMAWDNTEYFCLSTNYSRSGSKEIYNRIAGWAFDNANIWKNSVYLGSDGSIYNGTKWRLNNDGSGQLANGNIVWDAAGNVSFGASVSLNWTNAANNALNSAKSYADTKKTEAINSAATDATNKSEAAKELAQAMAFGNMLFRDPTFYNGQNNTSIYNNNGNGTVSVTRVFESTAPNDSKYVLKIVNAGSASPGCGGFFFANICSYRKIFIARIIAKIPAGRTIQWATNAIGDGGTSKWLTSNAGTGDWAEYVYKVTCGTANFSSTNFFYIEGTATLTWYVAYATVFDITSSEKYTTTIDGNGIYTSTLNANQINAGTINADRIAAGSINASKLDAASIKADIINTSYINGLSCTFDKGTIGGWNINASQIYKNSVALSSDGSIVNGTKWRLNSDGSGQLANGNIVWDTVGNVSLKAIVATSGKIAGFTISGNKLINTAADSSIEFSSLMGNAVMYINSGNSLLSLRADSARTGITIQTYASGAKGMYIIANAGSVSAIESFGPHTFGQRSGERWCAPGVLYIGRKYSAGYNNYYYKVWGDGANVTSCSHLGDAQYRFYHNLGHTDYTVIAQIYGSTVYYGFFRLLDKATNYFTIQNVGSSGKPDQSAFEFTIFGRNKW